MTSALLSLSGIRPVFVVGHPRSGTTLVQLLITAHPVFSSAPETHFFSVVLPSNWENRALHSTELPLLFQKLAGKPGIVLNEVTKAELIRQAEGGGIAPALLLHQIMRFYAENGKSLKPTATRWLEKTPRHVNHIPQILKLFPDAQIINIVRDPRDVVSSNVRFQELSPETDREERRTIAINRSLSWNQMVTFAKDLLPHEPRLMSLTYEDLIKDPEANLTRMMAFLGEERTAHELESFGENYRAVALEKEDVRKQLCSVGEIVDRRGIWKTRMSDEEAQTVETLCHPLMREYGYPIEHELIPLQIHLEKLRRKLPQGIQRARARIYEKSRRGVGKVLRRVGLR